MTDKRTPTPASLELFLSLANDAANWSGIPLLGGNVATDKQLRGNLTDLKKKGLLTTFKDEGEIWVHFTEAGKALAAEHGISLQ
jgi:hypothetical protein